MTTPLVLTFVGRDRPGLVNAISERIAAAGGTWLESRLARLAGEFAGVVLVAAPQDKFEALAATLAGLETAGLRVTISPSVAAATPPSERLIALAIVGHERPGIVRDVTQALTRLGVNIEEFVQRRRGRAVHRGRDVPRRPAHPPARRPRRRRTAQDARAARRRDHGRPQRRRGRGGRLSPRGGVSPSDPPSCIDAAAARRISAGPPARIGQSRRFPMAQSRWTPRAGERSRSSSRRSTPTPPRSPRSSASSPAIRRWSSPARRASSRACSARRRRARPSCCRAATAPRASASIRPTTSATSSASSCRWRWC